MKKESKLFEIKKEDSRITESTGVFFMRGGTKPPNSQQSEYGGTQL